MNNTLNQLIKHISKFISLKEDDVISIKENFECIEIEKSIHLESENKLTKYLYFIDEGFVRVYYMQDGEEKTTQINCPSRFITSYQSFINQTLAYDNVQTVTSCKLCRITKSNLMNLSKKIADWEKFANSIYEQAVIFNEERTRDMILLNAEQRYTKLIQEQPDIIKNVPLQYIASYIGIKRESLSRIRKQISF